MVRQKVAKVIKESGYVQGSHVYKELCSILESYPRDELFQIDEADLLKNAKGIANISGRSQIKFFARQDKFNRFVSCLIFMPKTAVILTLGVKLEIICLKFMMVKLLILSFKLVILT